MAITRRATLAAALPALAFPGIARAAEPRHLSFAYDQPHNTGVGIAADIFSETLTRASGGAFVVDQFPAGQLGQDVQLLQKIMTGDIDLSLNSTANSTTVTPQSAVMSLNFVFRSEDHMQRCIADAAINAAMREIYESTVKDGHVLSLATLGMRNLYGKKEIHNVGDLRGLKVRVQATPTEDAIFTAYGAQTVHMPFGSIYTSIQTGVVDMAENGVNIYQQNKHYEVAPVMSLTQHEANNIVVWVSDKLWRGLSAEQKTWFQAAADATSREQPAKALALDHLSLTQLQKLGVRFVENVDKASFIKVAQPVQDQQAAELGPQAVKMLGMIRAIA